MAEKPDNLKTIIFFLLALMLSVTAGCKSESSNPLTPGPAGLGSLSGPIGSLSCTDFFGVPVGISAAPNAVLGNQVAIATIFNGFPVIFVNPSILATQQPITQQFWIAHECGHHVLGHNVGLGFPLTNEQAADCFGIQELDKLGLSAVQKQTIQQDLSFFQADFTHLPGTARAINLDSCLA